MGQIASLSLFGVAFLLAQGATAQSPQSAAPIPVPRAEFIRTMDGEFGKMDADKDKVVTRVEIEQYLRAIAVAEGRARSHALFTQLDSDKNGQLSATEFERMTVAPPPPNAAPILSQADLNKDGRITLVEYRTNKLASFDRVDTDKDGVVSVMEMKAAGVIK